MKLLYTVSLYKKPEQFFWLWQTIYNRHDAFILHVDRKTPTDVYEKFREIAGEADNILWLERQSVVWMGPGLVEIELEAIRAGLEVFGDFNYLMNLSGQDLQLRPREEIVEELKDSYGANYVSMEPLGALPFHIRRRPHLLTFQYGQRLIKTPLPRLIPRELKIHWKGSWWHVLEREFCKWIVEAPKAQAYRRFLYYVQAPDELYFQNVLQDSPLAGTTADRNRTFVKWSGIGGSPNTLTMVDHESIIDSRMFFARKFDCDVDMRLVQLVVENVAKKVYAHSG
ncbi:MAG: beta-1,6-N-acetylglucosaminyltransferase [Cyanobacteria bacterium J06638_22]